MQMASPWASSGTWPTVSQVASPGSRTQEAEATREGPGASALLTWRLLSPRAHGPVAGHHDGLLLP